MVKGYEKKRMRIRKKKKKLCTLVLGDNLKSEYHTMEAL
jgi:hypothetical protein